MADNSFYKNYGPFFLSSLIEDTDCSILGDENFLIKDINSLDLASSSELSFLSNKKYLKELNNIKVGVIIVEKKYAINNSKSYIISENPYYTFAQISRKFYPESTYPNTYFSKEDILKNNDDSVKISTNSFVHKSAKIGRNTKIGVNSFIGPGVSIGEDCIISDNVSIYFSLIKNNVKVSSGTRIGSEGFGFAIKGNHFLKIPQIGRVIVHDNVEIGSNTSIDRGSAGDTIINKNTMIDNLVHIAHNVEIGNNSIIAAMTGISGSTKAPVFELPSTNKKNYSLKDSIGKYVVMGGQVGITGHLIIGDNVKIAAKSGIMRNIDSNTDVGGYPAQPIRNWHKSTAFLMKNVRKK